MAARAYYKSTPPRVAQGLERVDGRVQRGIDISLLGWFTLPPAELLAVLLQVVEVEVVHVFGPLAAVGHLVQRAQRRVAQQRTAVVPRADVERDAVP